LNELALIFSGKQFKSPAIRHIAELKHLLNHPPQINDYSTENEIKREVIDIYLCVVGGLGVSEERGFVVTLKEFKGFFQILSQIMLIRFYLRPHSNRSKLP